MDCDIKREERYRSCDNPRPQNGGANCTGSDRESNDKEVCWTGTKCPSNCPPFTWYMDCARSCEHCVTDCNKFKGTCTACKAGFDSPLHSCNQSCPKYKYGLKCRGNCMEKCEGLDCTERVDGTCPDKSNNSWMYWLLLLLLLPFAYLLYYLFKPKQRLVFDEEEFKEDKNKSEPDF
ncbi:multiple epidermal growth factor-like domains protein 10 [Physella acuta]|uniref:multiple epidermal growth factor-like domains protein 10 n=1 Tax=Physella acuta TaxID=109671 RepID=UPI0027DCAE64|nr:multiple epidermal growth factor-like domains protein 10 [Physella acuta]